MPGQSSSFHERIVNLERSGCFIGLEKSYSLIVVLQDRFFTCRISYGQIGLNIYFLCVSHFMILHDTDFSGSVKCPNHDSNE